jgi:crossover junction endodeoxyribonuclease RuvC
LRGGSPGGGGPGGGSLVLGIDPGLATTGFALVRESGGAREVMEVGVLTTPAAMPGPRRLAQLHSQIADLLLRGRPGTAAVEQLFFGSNTTTAMRVGEARGVILLAMEQAGVEVVEYTPAQVKTSIAGYGKATKPQMMKMVRAITGLADKLPDDAFDAVALALCHLQSRRLNALKTR